jgi:hypothetical protein
MEPQKARNGTERTGRFCRWHRWARMGRRTVATRAQSQKGPQAAGWRPATSFVPLRVLVERVPARKGGRRPPGDKRAKPLANMGALWYNAGVREAGAVWRRRT